MTLNKRIDIELVEVKKKWKIKYDRGSLVVSDGKDTIQCVSISAAQGFLRRIAYNRIPWEERMSNKTKVWLTKV